MPGRLLFASTNEGKIGEAISLLSGLDCQVITLKELPTLDNFTVAETGNSFETNALLKAQAYAMQANLPTLAEDSGLTVDSLEGFPGVKSARWTLGTDTDRCEALLKKMSNVAKRTAHYVCVACLYHPITQQHLFFTGQIDGDIATALMGSGGFGYDPIFVPSGFEQTFAQLGQVVKNKHSHRQIALEQVTTYLSTHPDFLDL